MNTFKSRSSPASHRFLRNRAQMLDLVSEMRKLEERAKLVFTDTAEHFEGRVQLLPRNRLSLLLDPGLHPSNCKVSLAIPCRTMAAWGRAIAA